MRTSFMMLLAFTALLSAGCDPLESGRRLRLPKGDPDNGRAAFIALNCTNCHTVSGVELPKPTVAPDLAIELGGKVSRLRNVGDLMTSIMHPSEGISPEMQHQAGVRSGQKMPDVTDTMTVRQLVDLVRFLQPHYSQMQPPLDWRYYD